MRPQWREKFFNLNIFENYKPTLENTLEGELGSHMRQKNRSRHFTVPLSACFSWLGQIREIDDLYSMVELIKIILRAEQMVKNYRKVICRWFLNNFCQRQYPFLHFGNLRSSCPVRHDDIAMSCACKGLKPEALWHGRFFRLLRVAAYPRQGWVWPGCLEIFLVTI